MFIKYPEILLCLTTVFNNHMKVSEGPRTLTTGVMAAKMFATTRITYALEKY